MNKSKLFSNINEKHLNFSEKEIRLLTKQILKCIILSLIKGDRIEIRGFGSFSLHYKKSRIGCNPQNGSKIILKERYIPYFKPGKNLRMHLDKLI